MSKPWWIAVVQLALGVGLVVLASLVPEASAAHEVGVWLLGSAVGGALAPSVMAGGGGKGTLAAIVVACPLLLGCGGAGAVAGVTATDGVCETLEQQIEDRMNSGDLTEDQARCTLLGTRHACDAIIEKLSEGAE